MVGVGSEIEGRVRCVERHEQREIVSVLLLREEVQGEVAEGVFLESLDGLGSAVVNEGGVAIGAAAAGNGGPFGKAALRLIVMAHVPLAAHGGGVAAGFEDLGPGEQTVEPVAGFGAEGIFGEQPVFDAVGGREAAGHPGHAAGRADGSGGEGSGEAGAAGGETVDVGRADLARAVRAGGPGAVIVGHEEDDVGALHGALAGLHEGCGHGGEQEGAAVAVHVDHGNATSAIES